MSEFWCEECHNTGELDCYCGGDICVCTNYGTYPCPKCQSGHSAEDLMLEELHNGEDY